MVGWGLGRTLTAVLLLLLSLVVIALPVLFMAPILTDQLTQGMQTVQDLFQCFTGAAGLVGRRAVDW